MNPTRILVTGGAGFIGANYVHLRMAQEDTERLVVLDALTYAGNRHNLADFEGQSNYRFVHGDVRNREAVETLLREENLDGIVHFAAESHVDRSIHGPGEFMDANVRGTFELLEAARSVWLDSADVPHRFHHVSTDEVYGSLGLDDAPFCETTPFAPNSPYAASKAASDHVVRAYHKTYGLDATISHCSNNYGPFQFPEKLIPLVLLNLLHGKNVPVYGDGSNIRDWIHVQDHCSGVDAILRKSAGGEVYDLGGNAERRNLDLVRALCANVDAAFATDATLAEQYPESFPAQDRPCEDSISFVVDRPGHDHRYAINCAKAAADLGFQPSVTLDQGLQNTLDWYLQNQPWWKQVQDGGYRDWIELQYGN